MKVELWEVVDRAKARDAGDVDTGLKTDQVSSPTNETNNVLALDAQSIDVYRGAVSF